MSHVFKGIEELISIEMKSKIKGQILPTVSIFLYIVFCNKNNKQINKKGFTKIKLFKFREIVIILK